jgi:cyclase
MVETRVIPCLLWLKSGLVKTVNFKNPTYVGDPINAVRIFNEKGVDELVILDISATANGSEPNFELIRSVASECFMPLCYGGGIRSIEHIKKILHLGVEKVCLNSIAVEDPSFIQKASDRYGSSTIVVCIDYKKNWLGKKMVMSHAGKKSSKYGLVEFARLAESMGAGEIVLQSMDHDGKMQGYDIATIREVAQQVGIPVVALGGAGKVDHIRQVISEAHISAVAAGSMFVFRGEHKAVLINYPSKELFNN